MLGERRLPRVDRQSLRRHRGGGTAPDETMGRRARTRQAKVTEDRAGISRRQNPQRHGPGGSMKRERLQAILRERHHRGPRNAQAGQAQKSGPPSPSVGQQADEAAGHQRQGCRLGNRGNGEVAASDCGPVKSPATVRIRSSGKFRAVSSGDGKFRKFRAEVPGTPYITIDAESGL
jgi:hypothetical protein